MEKAVNENRLNKDSSDINKINSRSRRSAIPLRPQFSLSILGFLRNCIGKELSRIPLPVNFNEPISFLQRVTEDLTYSHCLDRATEVGTENVIDRMAWICAFSVSCYASTAFRTCKPFNPLLGETYELDRSDDEFGWRSIAEQISHHPPIVAHYCESTRFGWKYWQEFTVESKFRGMYISIIPKGITHLLFNDGHHYTWSKVTITVNNIVGDRIRIENEGETCIRNAATKHACKMIYEKHSYFHSETNRHVHGIITDVDNTQKYKIEGVWDSHVEGYHIDTEGKCVGSVNTLWTAFPQPPDAELMYNFSKFAIELNEPDESVAPTDSRFRPDQRLMEDGHWDEANVEKERLEIRQRLKSCAWESFGVLEISEFGPPYRPQWFSEGLDEFTNERCISYNGKYWPAKENKDWSKCPTIF